jgi:hypothetical protein
MASIYDDSGYCRMLRLVDSGLHIKTTEHAAHLAGIDSHHTFTGVCKPRTLHVVPEVVLISAQANVKRLKLCDTVHERSRLTYVPQP